MDEDFEKRAYERQRARWEDDSDDLHRETAGVQGNRIARFKGDDADARLGAGKKRDADKDDLADFVLADILTTTRDMLTRRIDLLDRASLAALREAEERLDATRRAANRAKDGRRVYQTEDGRYIYDEEGNEVSRDEIDWAEWKSDAPTRESYQQFVAERDAVKDFRTVVQRQGSRLQDDDLSQAELEDIEASLDKLDMPASVRAHYDRLKTISPGPDTATARTTSAAAEHDAKPGFETAPKVAESFTVAVGGPPDTAQQEPAVPSTQPHNDFTA